MTEPVAAKDSSENRLLAVPGASLIVGKPNWTEEGWHLGCVDEVLARLAPLGLRHVEAQRDPDGALDEIDAPGANG